MSRYLHYIWLLLLGMGVSAGPVNAIEINQYPEIESITNRLVAEGVYDSGEIEQLFASVEFNPEIIRAFKRPAERLSWARYRDLFITDQVISNGVKFWEQHQVELTRAAEQYGVPEEIIVAITGIETRFGASKGKHAVIDSLSTLAVQYERRKAFFQSELESFLRLAKSEGLNPRETLGSYAGAMGIPQFIASSYHGYAVDFDGDGKRDLVSSYADAIGSVANYFRRHHWRTGQPVADRLTKVNSQKLDALLQAGKSPGHSVSVILEAGFDTASSYPGQLAADIITLDGPQGTEYWLGF